MSSVYLKGGKGGKGGKFWARIKGLHKPGKWGGKRTEYGPSERPAALRYAARLQAGIDGQADAGVLRDPTFDDYATVWSAQRKRDGTGSKSDRTHLKRFLLPTLGKLRLRSIGTPELVALFARIRTEPYGKRDRPPSARYVHNIYSTAKAVFRDARLAGKIEASPCVLTTLQLGPLVDANPERRDGALFTRAEAELLISDPRIPEDRQLIYGFGVLAGMRPGEVSALRFRHWDPTKAPLGQLTVAKAYSTDLDVEKGTKTRAVRYVPVHPTLAAMLYAWRAWGWRQMMGREPTPDDLILPLPPAALGRRRRRKGEAYRGAIYIWGEWTRIDLPALGWRYRTAYDTKATFITLALDDGADATILKTRVTHAKPRRDAFDGYNRGLQWAATCAEVGKLALTRPAAGPVGAVASGVPFLLPGADSSSERGRELLGVSGPDKDTPFRGDNVPPVDAPGPRAVNSAPVRTEAVASLATVEELADAVLAGDLKLARKLARQLRRPELKATR